MTDALALLVQQLKMLHSLRVLLTSREHTSSAWCTRHSASVYGGVQQPATLTVASPSHSHGRECVTKLALQPFSHLITSPLLVPLLQVKPQQGSSYRSHYVEVIGVVEDNGCIREVASTEFGNKFGQLAFTVPGKEQKSAIGGHRQCVLSTPASSSSLDLAANPQACRG